MKLPFRRPSDSEIMRNVLELNYPEQESVLLYCVALSVNRNQDYVYSEKDLAVLKEIRDRGAGLVVTNNLSRTCNLSVKGRRTLLGERKPGRIS